jgi:serralysin
MAKVLSKVAFDMTSKGDMNFGSLLEGRDVRFSEKLIRLEYLATGERDTFRGSFSADASANTVRGSAKTWTHSKNGRLQWEITNASISASKVLEAAKSKTSRDDKVLIEKIFAGDDKITGSRFVDKLFGYEGNDTIDSGLGAGIDKIDGGAGHDRVSYANSLKSFEIKLTGATISVALRNGVADDKIVNVEDVAGGWGNDKLTGDRGANLLIGNGGNDTLIGAGGNDTLVGGKGADRLVGNKGDDSLDGGGQADILLGGAGKDKLIGGKGIAADSLFGGGGTDSLSAGAGLDLLVGGGGRDTMTGGADADTFRFVAITESGVTATTRDFITDFVHKLDKIDLSAIDAVASTVGINDAFIRDAKGNATTAVAEGHIGWYTVNAAGTANDRTYLRINNDADAAVDMTIELKGLIKIGPVDFIL